MRFELIDQVLEREPGRIVAVKAVTAAEEYLQDHFPGFPVLPGVLMLEVMVQAARLLVGPPVTPDTPPGAGEPLVLAEVNNVRYGNMVKPGQQLIVEVTIRQTLDDGWHFQGVGKVNDKVAVQGRFRLIRLSNAA